MPEVQKISIALTSEQVDALHSAVDAGDFATISEVVREAVRGWQRKNKTYLREVKRQRLYWERRKNAPQIQIAQTPQNAQNP